MSQPLWSESNKTLYSSVFTVPPGKVCVLFAARLQKFKYRENNEDFLSPQTVCIRRLVHDFDANAFSKCATKGDCSCNWVFDLSETFEFVIADEGIQTCKSSCWALTEGQNLGVIGIPGTYRLELNDATAIGEAQVYADLYDAKNFPSQVSSLFFS